MIRYLRGSDFPNVDATWQLVEWCARRGLDEFRVSFMQGSVANDPFLVGAERRLRQFAKEPALRTLMTVPLGQPQTQTAALWSYSDAALTTLKELLPEGLFDYLSNRSFKEGWLEDPTFYRRGELMLGIVSHEQEGLIDLTAAEWVEFSATGIPTHKQGTWI